MINDIDKFLGIYMLVDNTTQSCLAGQTDNRSRDLHGFLIDCMKSVRPGQEAPDWIIAFDGKELVEYLAKSRPDILASIPINGPARYIDLSAFDNSLQLPYELSITDALYCVKNDIPLLSPDADNELLSMRPGYMESIEEIQKCVPDLRE